MIRIAAILLFFFVVTALRAGDDTKIERTMLQIPKVSQPPKLEDFLNDRNGKSNNHNDYIEAEITDFRQYEPGDGIPVSQETRAYLSYDDKNLFVVFVCKDDPSKVRGRMAKREDISSDDQVIVYLDTFHDKQRAYMFATNPLGIQLDGIITEGQDEDFSFDTLWRSDGRLTSEGYIVRMTIPFKSIRFSNDSTQTWGVAFGRIIQRNNEESYWPHITKRVKGFVPQFAVSEGLQQISPGRNIRHSTAFLRARDSSIRKRPNTTQPTMRISGWTPRRSGATRSHSI
jgi:hypothetical protein